jgi:N-methylhydantoinase A
VEINTYRLEGRIPAQSARAESVRTGSLSVDSDAAGDADALEAAKIGVRDVVFSGTPARTAVYAGERLPSGVRIAGPAIAEFAGTTVVVGPGQKAVADADGHILMSPAQK